MSAADPSHLFIASEYGPNTPDAVLVSDAVAADEQGRDALDKLGIRSADVRGELGALVDSGFNNYSPTQWKKFWKLVAHAGNAAAELLSGPAKRGELCNQHGIWPFPPHHQNSAARSHRSI